MSVSSRIPVVITDKNNRVTTVYRNPASEIKTLNVPLPKPAKVESVETRAARAMERLEIGEMYQQTAMHNLSFLAEHDQQLLDSILERCDENMREKQLWITQLCSHYLPQRGVEGDSYHVARYRWRYELQSSAIKIGAILSPGELGHFTTDNLLSKADLLHGDDDVEDWDLQHARLIGIGIEESEMFMSPDRKADIEFFKENLETIEPIFPELVARKTISREFIEGLLNHPTPAVREGLL